jgi:hypothetical protein
MSQPREVVSMVIREMTVEVKQVGWEGQEQQVPLLLLGQKHRRLVGTFPGGTVCASLTDDPMRKIIVVVSKQFKSLTDGATVNQRLADLLNVRVGMTIVVGNVVIEQTTGGNNEPTDSHRGDAQAPPAPQQ